MSTDLHLDRLHRAIKELRIEYERFFNGAVQVPPETLRTQVERMIRSLRNSNMQGAAEQFRLNSLEARFNSLCDLSKRRLRDQEEGRGPRVAAAGPRREGPDVRDGVRLGSSVDDSAAEALYTGLHKEGRAQFDLDSFKTYLQRQVKAIQAKTGCREVQFRLADENGKIKLKAKPIRAGRSAKA